MEKLEETSWNDEEGKFDAKKKWKLVGNVVRATQLMKIHDIRVINDVEELIKEVRMSPDRRTSGKRVTLTGECIYEYKITEKLFFHIRRSNPDDLIQIVDIIENNPKRFTRTTQDPDSFVNKINHQGVRPLYEACKNGYVQTVQLLLNQGADPHLLSESNTEKESNLEVSCRWGHLPVVNFLLLTTSWTNKELKKAFGLTQNPEIKLLLKNNMMNAKCCLCCLR